MVFEESDIQTCLRKAVEIRDLYDLYVLNGKARMKSVDDLTWVCVEYLEKRITIEYADIPVEGSSIKAAFLALDDGSYRIGLLTGMSEEEERFVLCKELFHVIFDEDSRRSLDLESHLEDYTTNIVVDDGRPNCAAAWETLAEIAATEFLLPFEVREAHLNSGNAVDFAKLATRYGLPRLHVEIACGTGNLSYIRKHMKAAGLID
ncbi:ImmA/IrrE family metallo-endopeptidase [Stenotrophomonas sp. NPDC078853]|uniref:ImmA/IrrE family metallo-endopeptidase n=1 Tax=Stenotrophomonas sp. NPDC078853 TaxID=3364534 RepID=UPI00385010EA